MFFQGLTFILLEDPPENNLMVIGDLLLKYYVLLLIYNGFPVFRLAVLCMAWHKQ